MKRKSQPNVTQSLRPSLLFAEDIKDLFEIIQGTLGDRAQVTIEAAGYEFSADELSQVAERIGSKSVDELTLSTGFSPGQQWFYLHII